MRKENYTVGLLNWHYYTNFGSMLQAYALQHVIAALGYNPIFLNYRKKYVKPALYVRLAWSILYRLPYNFVSRYLRRFFYPCDRFVYSFFNQTSILKSKEDFETVTSGIKSFICGSDQIWAPNVFNPIYMLSFVPDNVRKVSYAASIGLNKIPKSLVLDYCNYIGRLDYVSVREEQGQKILNSQCGIKAEVVLDPTLLLDIAEWKKIEIGSKIKKAYIFCYFLKKDHKYKNAIMKFAKRHGYEIYGVSDNPKDAKWMHVLSHKEVGPREFLGFINKAQVVITDSYHGTIFSLLYHKDLITIERFNSTDEICQNSRIDQLVSYFGITDNVVKIDERTNLVIHPIDYIGFEKSLQLLRESSLNFLIKALK